MTSQSKRELHLGLFLFSTGYHPAGWRLPEAITDGAFDNKFLKRVARKLEEGKFDFFFLGDRLSSSPEMQHQFPSQMIRLEPFTTLSYLAAATEQLGLIVTVNSTYSEPYHIARMTASLDHISEGRLALNMVTGADPSSAFNFSREKHWDNAKRYDYAEEFVGVVKKLWDSWEDEALIRDKESGYFADSEKVHRLDHKGDHFSIAGPLNVARPPQGQIPLLSAGTSERSRQLGAAYSSAIFTGDILFEEAKKFYADMKSRLRDYGREQNELFVLPGLSPLVGRTAEEARAKYAELNSLLVTNYDLGPLSQRIGIDLSDYPLDGPLPDLSLSTQSEEKVKQLVGLTQNAVGYEDITVRDLFHYFSATSRGHLLLVGDPVQIADEIERWFVNEAADGFNICPPYMIEALELFVDLVVPILQERGLFRKEYTASTFRGHFGLSKPANQFAK
ncbi:MULTISPECIES: LLM class flavin-dependent oxidoreductase [unclassified Paenibacillus]|uniref:LLM class flavin-dependent oxidoreductase n=1 Tax=unclassified Paenibacillus TaxID=185978 RepID=UPI002F412DEC